ncbi:MAG: beta-galactosidase [Patescibacteria group bacterium]|nr:beta-galactosidase [Patescibacteria group bacterium]
MKPKLTKLKKNLLIAGLAFAIFVVLAAGSFSALNLTFNSQQTFGVTFSKPYAEEFKLEPNEVLTATLDDLGVRRFRIPAYWSLIETKQGILDWSWLDSELDIIAKRDGKVVLAIGQKLPRWPECWIPDWAIKTSEADREKAASAYLEQTINRYKNNSTIISWQIENEPGFTFGVCPQMRKGFFDDEVKLVRSLDDRPIATTDSGELAFWSIGNKVDQLGVSVYRVVIGPLGTLRYWFVPPQFYLRKGQAMSALWGFKKIYISELQMEPWTKRSTLLETPLDEQMQTFDLKQMNDNIDFAKNSGISTIDLWGVEWWYWMKTVNNRPEFWDATKTLF